ncbi:uncharacterized protein LOC107005548 isoform X2 [Solanum pennellii]|uniref:Uncharacterized protein LOC107005548 isoform X2 n=1 Tax=Solanum pennellii TaxID=28526 RepID=A0ABM1V036_SOLPN|nr:uncharacterized protein LOC107005548 isoform X2 [Solanum pennellii]
MGLLTHKVERSEIASGDHIYSWRTVFAYSHHGDPILFSAPLHCSSASSTNVSSTCTNIPDCGFQQKESGVVLSCLDCFLGEEGLLYRFDYGASPSVFLTKLRGGTCTTAQSDPPEAVIHRAMYLLQNGFGNYDVFKNNCEDFALYCKTGLLVLDQGALGRSGQAASVIGAPLAAIASSPLKLFMTSPAGLVVATVGMYCLTRYATDIGVRTDVTKVKVEELTSFHNCKSSKKRKNENHSDTREVTLNQTDTPAKTRRKCD